MVEFRKGLQNVTVHIFSVLPWSLPFVAIVKSESIYSTAQLQESSLCLILLYQYKSINHALGWEMAL